MTPAPNARDLISRARAGDRAAFDALASKYRSLLQAFVRSELGAQLRGRVEAGDIVQETFLKAFRSIDQFEGATEAAFRGWLLAIARNVIRGQGRRLSSQKASLGREVSLDAETSTHSRTLEKLAATLVSKSDSPSRILRGRERYQRLKKALGSLVPDHRRVIVLARLEELPMKEVARRMARSPKAASNLLARALRELKAAFGSTDSFHLPVSGVDAEGGGLAP